jgi:hypothetical protein
MFLASAAGVALAQMAGGGMGGSGTSSGMMSAAMGAQMMGGQMMKADMMSGLAGTMMQMDQMMQKMAGRLRQPMDRKAMRAISGALADLSGMMKELSSQMGSGKMDPDLVERMNVRMAALGRSLDATLPADRTK